MDDGSQGYLVVEMADEKAQAQTWRDKTIRYAKQQERSRPW